MLQERDCAGAEALIDRWHANRPAGMTIRVLVVGMPDVADALRDRLPARPGVTVGSLDVQSGALLGAKLGYRSTLFAVLLDDRGRLAGTSPGSWNLPASAIQALVADGRM